jgi:PTH1 family peptidyl-tRNA hydrolase
MKLIVGLGNPGRKYEGTRHNIGFDVLDEVARRCGAASPANKFEGRLAEASFGGERALLLWPQTFMNLSGTSVGKVRDFYRLADNELLVVCDDFNLPLARLRFRKQGSSGGQKGLGDIVRRLGTEEINRLRIGVGPVPDGWEGADFVLGKFTKSEGVEVELVVARAADAVADWATQGIDYCMNRYNAASDN